MAGKARSVPVCGSRATELGPDASRDHLTLWRPVRSRILVPVEDEGG